MQVAEGELGAHLAGVVIELDCGAFARSGRAGVGFETYFELWRKLDGSAELLVVDAGDVVFGRRHDFKAVLLANGRGQSGRVFSAEDHDGGGFLPGFLD